MVFQHPLGYLFALEGLALLRAFGGEHDREFTKRRLAEIAELSAAVGELGDGAELPELGALAGYEVWAEFYDGGGNVLLDIEQPVVWRILAGLEPGTAVDVACGTGRHTVRLAELGHRVTGVDASAPMLAKARAKLPGVTFLEADLHRLPMADASVDTVVCALALNHVDELGPAFAEFARVLRPGGHLVVSDHRNLLGNFDWPLLMRGPDGRFGYIPNRTHATSAYLTAALPAGFEVRHCEEPLRPTPFVDDDGIPPGQEQPLPPHDPNGPPNIWALHPFAAQATNAAYRDTAAAIVWHFQLRD